MQCNAEALASCWQLVVHLANPKKYARPITAEGKCIYYSAILKSLKSKNRNKLTLLVAFFKNKQNSTQKQLQRISGKVKC